jgi:TatD DNase family protein
MDMRTIIDSHAHLGWDSFKDDQDDVIRRSLAEGIIQIVQAGVDLQNIDNQLALAERYQHIYNGVGLHPHEAKDWTAESADVLRKAAAHASVVAVGECGLDFYYNHSERDTQIRVFKEQVALAIELDLPIIIHTRDAWDETFEVLMEKKGKIRGVFHCFTGSPIVMPLIRELDFYVSFSGIVTFAKATDIQETAPLVAADRITVETDSPYLAPQGKRGKRNEPSFIWFTAEKLAALRSTTVDEIARITSDNARRLFKLPVPVHSA